jgi:segregation and condensation protein B
MERMMSASNSTENAVDTRALEALFFVSDEPLSASVLAQTLELDRRQVEGMCGTLQATLEERGSGLVLRNVAGGWRLFTHPDVQPEVERFVLSSRQARLTKAALEALAIVAYKQPVTRHQVSAIRGVNSDGVLRALQDRGLIEEVGREATPGRPVLYATTPQFLERLGLPSLASLPSLAPLLDSASDPGSDEPDGADPQLDSELDPERDSDVLVVPGDEEPAMMPPIEPGGADGPQGS